jgi:hypothetical protein
MATQCRRAQVKTGKPVAAQILEILRLRAGPGRLGTSEYYDFRLYDDARLTWEQKRQFGGYRAQKAIEDTVIDDYSQFLSLDKITFDTVMRAHGFPLPRLQAIYHPGGRKVVKDVALLRDKAMLADFLRNEMSYPFYAKPSNGGYGTRNLSVLARDDERLIMASGPPQTINDFCATLSNPSELGFLFQDALQPAAETVAICGDRLSGVRLQVLLGKNGPQVFRAMWKIPVGHNIMDNFQHGRSKNLLGAVDRESGIVKRVIAGVGLDQVENPQHPDTGAEALGFALPCWKELKTTVLEAATVFPGFLAQGWDIALTNAGPVLLEVNMLGDLDLSQYAYGIGFMDDEFLDFLDERRLRPLVEGPTDACAKNQNNRIGRRKSHWSY